MNDYAQENAPENPDFPKGETSESARYTARLIAQNRKIGELKAEIIDLQRPALQARITNQRQQLEILNDKIARMAGKKCAYVARLRNENAKLQNDLAAAKSYSGSDPGSTLGDCRSSAEICRGRGWKVGTRITGDEGYGSKTIEITAIGEHEILACSGPDRRNESMWLLGFRDWQEVSKMQNWIKADVRQPEAGCRVWAYCPNASQPHKVLIWNVGDYWSDWSGKRVGVSHWMPLPPKPEGT